MARTPEGAVKELVTAVFKEFGAYYYMPVPGGYGATTVDYLACFLGWFIAVETKAPGKKPTARQETVLRELRAADAAIFVIDGPAGVANLRAYLKTAYALGDL